MMESEPTPDHGDRVPTPRFSGHVLLVEDNDVSALIAKAELQRFGVSVDRATDGANALEYFTRKVFDLVLMDCEMPLMDGFETTKRIRLVERTQGRKPTPVVAFTATALTGGRNAFIAKGMDDYLRKPLYPGALKRILRKFLPMTAV